MLKKKNLGTSKLLRKIDGASLVGLDSVVFLYFLEKEMPWAPLCKLVLERIEQGQVRGVTSVVTILETLSLPELEVDEERQKFFTQFYHRLPNLEVVDMSMKIVLEAARLRRQFLLKSPDAIQAATALVKSTDLFITNDRDFVKIGKQIGVIILDDYV
ncbi:hypothetical protein B5M47_03205 [candidate division CPR3 bacterium 4484_211]|uniref:PIN domain-containing protein n=1 Tax=candidate division CPR3 bacterium 4484_211 TaxID=1968527 RepID=A0A1W9NX87_UNCC3|nr:MAG: hypothetical protein B5M47_03205 [candidate division CPR3 bacterium 4484_211]